MLKQSQYVEFNDVIYINSDKMRSDAGIGGRILLNLCARKNPMTTPSVPAPLEMPEGSIPDKKLTFCDKNSVESIFFYNELPDRAGRLFWNVEGSYREALTVLYGQKYQDKVENIIWTIQKN